MASLAELLAYKQKQAEMLNSLPKEPTLGQRLENLSYAAGEGFSDQLRGLGQMVRHPWDSGVAIVQGIGQMIQHPQQAYQAAAEGIKEATKSPETATKFLAQNFNPLELANALNKVGTIRELTVYHGTPHTLPPTANNPLGEFDASKIGTGEGAAAYGHGIYVAENPAVAKDYQTKLSKDTWDRPPVRTFMGENLTYGTPEYHAATLMSRHGMTLTQAKKDVSRWIAEGEQDPRLTKEVEGWKRTLETLNQAKKKTDFKERPDPGSLYKIDLPDEKIDQMLDWDKPLSEQPHVIKALANTDDEFQAYRQQLSPKFQKIVDDMVSGELPVHGDEAIKSWEALQRAYPNLDHNAIHDVRYRIFPNTSEGDWLHNVLSGSAAPGSGVKGGGGADLYNSLGGGAEASAKLRAAGIPGIKYLDEQSRAKGTGTRNFVVFPGEEKNLKILSRE